VNVSFRHLRPIAGGAPTAAQSERTFWQPPPVMDRWQADRWRRAAITLRYCLHWALDQDRIPGGAHTLLTVAWFQEWHSRQAPYGWFRFPSQGAAVVQPDGPPLWRAPRPWVTQFTHQLDLGWTFSGDQPDLGEVPVAGPQIQPWRGWRPVVLYGFAEAVDLLLGEVTPTPLAHPWKPWRPVVSYGFTPATDMPVVVVQAAPAPSSPAPRPWAAWRPQPGLYWTSSHEAPAVTPPPTVATYIPTWRRRRR